MHNSDTLVGAAAVKSEQLWLRPQHARSTGQEVGAGGAGGGVQQGGGGFNKITFYWPLGPRGVFVCLRA